MPIPVSLMECDESLQGQCLTFRMSLNSPSWRFGVILSCPRMPVRRGGDFPFYLPSASCELTPKTRSSSRLKRVYFAHAVCVYGSEEEKSQLTKIRHRFRRAIIFNPADYRGHPEKRLDSMGFCFKLIDFCDSVVFTRILGKVTSGVGKQVNFALSRGKQVHELAGERLIPVRRPVSYVSRERTRVLYRAWRHSQRGNDEDAFPRDVW